MSIQQEKIKELVERRAGARLGGGQKRIDAQHAKGKFLDLFLLNAHNLIMIRLGL